MRLHIHSPVHAELSWTELWSVNVTAAYQNQWLEHSQFSPCQLSPCALLCDVARQEAIRAFCVPRLRCVKWGYRQLPRRSYPNDRPGSHLSKSALAPGE